MKIFHSLLLLCAATLLAQSSAWADPLFGAYAKSPDHPHTWVLGADNIHQALRWDGDRQMLFADVKYSTVAYADNTHPTQENDFVLSFPSVRLDSATGVLTAHGTKIGTVHHGFFGAEVSLDRGVELSIHRHHGVVYGAIIPSEVND